MNRTLTGIEGLRVGHWTGRGTGCTVVLAPPEGCLASGAFFGPSPGTREAVLLEPGKRVDRINAVLLSGGSAFGLAAAQGVVRYCAERGWGYPTRVRPVPIVPAAILYDLAPGVDPPGEEAGYAACQVATPDPVERGRVGAGCGATAGKYLDPVPTGVGSALLEEGGERVGALAVPNPVGDIWSPEGVLVAGHGAREALLRSQPGIGHTTLVVVGVEAQIEKSVAYQLAVAAQAALARVIRPSHTPWDGDSVFILSTARRPLVSLAALFVLVQEVVVEAILDAARSAASSG
jgi:L-aminopeptidase/D-esterase-like protein